MSLSSAPPQPLTDSEVRFCDETERLLFALSFAEKRIAASVDRAELHKLSEFFQRVAREVRNLSGPSARTEDARIPLELASIAFQRAASQKTHNRTGIWTKAMSEGTIYYEKAREFYSEFASG